MKRVLGEAGKVAFIISSRVVGYLLLGVLLNVTLMLLLRPELAFLAGGGTTAAGGAAAAVPGLVSSLKYQLGMVGVAALFGVLFPFSYFALGKSQGVRGAIHALAARRTEALVGHVSYKLLHWARRRPDWQSRLEKGGLQQAIDQIGPTFFEKQPGVSRWMRALVRGLRRKVPFTDAVMETVKQSAGSDATSEQQLTESARPSSIALREQIERRFGKPGFLLPIAVLGANIAAFAALKLGL